MRGHESDRSVRWVIHLRPTAHYGRSVRTEASRPCEHWRHSFGQTGETALLVLSLRPPCGPDALGRLDNCPKRPLHIVVPKRG